MSPTAARAARRGVTRPLSASSAGAAVAEMIAEDLDKERNNDEKMLEEKEVEL